MSWRQKLAKQICTRLAALPSVTAVIIGGSVSQGREDEYSNLDVGVFWAGHPHDHDRKVVAKGLKASFLTPLEKFDPVSKKATGTEDNLIMEGFQVNLCHSLVDRVKESIYDVIVKFDANLQKQTLLANIKSCLPLYGAEEVEKWRGQLVYPKELADKMVSESLPIILGRNIETTFKRKDWLLFHIQTTNFVRRLFNVMYGLNSEFYNSYKHYLSIEASFKVKPEGFDDLLNTIVTKEPDAVMPAITKMIAAVTAVVEQKLPNVNVAAIKEEYSYIRRPFKEAPSALSLSDDIVN